MQEIETLLDFIFENEELISAILSSPQKKIAIRPLLIRKRIHYQVTENRENQAFHHNLTKEECLKWLKEQWKNFKQAFFFTQMADYHLLIGKKGKTTLLKRPPSKIQSSLEHNRKKNYLLKEGEAIPFLVQLGVMNASGKVYADKKDKFGQINRFLEMVEDVLSHFDHSQKVRIIDFGCGKAYLTFALYYYLKVIKKFDIQLIGIDQKQEVIKLCQELAMRLNEQKDLQFICEDINQFQISEKVDLVVSLHACDTATDAALEKAVFWDAKVILCVPCCQHELMHQIQHDALQPLLKHGILKERFAALATDAARAQLLECLGYQTQVLEFIDIEHTPKNLLIRAIKDPSKNKSIKAWKTYLDFKKALHIDPSFERRVKNLDTSDVI